MATDVAGHEENHSIQEGNDGPKTITMALQVHKNPLEAYKAYHPYVAMTKRLIGDEPCFYPILTLSNAAVNTHVGLFARMFACPEVDMRLPGQLTPTNRRLAFIAASETFNCDYCTAHACSFGDMMKGSRSRQVKRGSKRMSPMEKRGQRTVWAFANAAVKRPYNPDNLEISLVGVAKELRKLLGDKGLETVKAVISFSGALNTVMDVQGVKLEEGTQNFAMGAKDGWKPNEHHYNESEEANKKDDTRVGFLSGIISNIVELMKTMPPAMTAMRFETSVLYNKIPKNNAQLDQWVEERLGARGSKFFQKINGTEVKRAFCFALRENLLVDGNCASGERREWNLTQRLCFLHLFATVTGSEELRDQAVEIFRTKVNRDEAERTLQSFTEGADSSLPEGFAAGRALVEAVAEKCDNIPRSLVKNITSACSPEACLELASLLSFLEMWRRESLLFLLDD
mmetsp:Transcript_5657/g.16819  ORF Transcript_5657/g.16819 Transcript_5657/m.16819 type:complete len:456 (+) Transcript_5657:102-1469(+)